LGAVSSRSSIVPPRRSWLSRRRKITVRASRPSTTLSRGSAVDDEVAWLLRRDEERKLHEEHARDIFAAEESLRAAGRETKRSRTVVASCAHSRGARLDPVAPRSSQLRCNSAEEVEGGTRKDTANLSALAA